MSEPASLPLAVAADSAPGRPVDGRARGTDRDTLLRLALWLADVAAEAALAAQAGDADSTAERETGWRPPKTEESPGAEVAS